MVYCWELRNRENHFVAAAILEINFTDDTDTLDDVFSDKIEEYNWEEDQTDENALMILRDTLFSIIECEHLHWAIPCFLGLEGNNNLCKEKLFRNEYTYKCNPYFGFITFNENYEENYHVDIVCSKAHEDDLGLY